jgi:hypothetical protein
LQAPGFTYQFSLELLDSINSIPFIERAASEPRGLGPMAKKFSHDFHRTECPVPWSKLIILSAHQRELFEVFFLAPETGGKVTATKDNEGAIVVLAKEC